MESSGLRKETCLTKPIQLYSGINLVKAQKYNNDVKNLVFHTEFIISSLFCEVLFLSL